MQWGIVHCVGRNAFVTQSTDLKYFTFVDVELHAYKGFSLEC